MTVRDTRPDSDEIVEQTTVPFDENLLECARTQWQLGDWTSLCRLEIEAIQHHPQRAKLALLAAAGRFQLGDKHDAYRYIRIAKDWGCSDKLIAQILISGAYNSLGCAVAMLQQSARAKEHFRNAVTLGGVAGDANLLADVREARQVRGRNEKYIRD